jgi:hypothetical protein
LHLCLRSALALKISTGCFAGLPLFGCFIIFDELGYLPFAESGGQRLFQLTVTTNLAFGEWPSVFARLIWPPRGASGTEQCG